MVLAAGSGERMGPLTNDRAKPALPLMNRPLIHHVLDRLARHGVLRAVVNLHHRPESLTALLETGTPERMTVVLSPEPAILGTAGGIRAALGHLEPDAPVLVVNADCLSDADLPSLAAADRAARAGHGAVATLAVRARAPDEPYAPVHLDDRGLIVGIGGEGETGEACTFTGLHILSPEVIARIPETGPSDIVRDVYMPMLREGRRLGAWRHRGWWVEIGNPALYLKAHLDLLAEPGFMGSLPPSAGAPVRGVGPSFAGERCEGLKNARLDRAVLGPGCRLGDGCVVTGSLLAAGVRVGRGAQIEDSILWEGVAVPTGYAIHSSLVLAPGEASGSLRTLPLR